VLSGGLSVGAKNQDGADLGHSFDDEDAGHHGIFGPVALEEGLIDGNVFDSERVVAGGEGNDSVYEKEWEAVREDFHNAGDIEGGLGPWFLKAEQGVALGVAV